MRVRVLHAKICIIAYALPGLTARQLLNSSTLLDIARQLDSSTELDRPRHPGTYPAHAVSLDLPRRARQILDSSTRQLLDSYSRQLLDSYSTGSTGKALTAPRQWPRQRLDGASTAVDPARQPRGSIHNRHHTVKAKFLRAAGAELCAGCRFDLNHWNPGCQTSPRSADFSVLEPTSGDYRRRAARVTKHFAVRPRAARSAVASGAVD